MDAQLSRIAINPPKRDKDGEIVSEETAVITLSVLMDTVSQKDNVKELFDILSNEWVKLEITTHQTRMPLTAVDE
jgi:hypothetical protein